MPRAAWDPGFTLPPRERAAGTGVEAGGTVAGVRAMLPEGGTAARFLETGLGVGCWSQGSPTGRQKAGRGGVRVNGLRGKF